MVYALLSSSLQPLTLLTLPPSLMLSFPWFQRLILRLLITSQASSTHAPLALSLPFLLLPTPKEAVTTQYPEGSQCWGSRFRLQSKLQACVPKVLLGISEWMAAITSDNPLYSTQVSKRRRQVSRPDYVLIDCCLRSDREKPEKQR